MKRLLILATVLVLTLSLAGSAFAADGMARIRVAHASPDAPAVDVWVNGAVAFSSAPFTGITDYASLAPGSYQIQVTPAGVADPVVIDAVLDLAADTDYTVVAVGELASIEPLVLIDNNSAPAAGKAHVRFVHASPDAPAVDIAVAGGGPILFANVTFKGTGDYLPVDAGTYDLEVRLAGTNTVALSVPGVSLSDGTVYTIFAMGLAGGEPTLTAVPSADVSFVTLQDGLNGYAGTTDTYIDLGNADTNWGAADRVRTKTTENADALVRFDLSGLPADATIKEAKLRLYAIDNTGIRPIAQDELAFARPNGFHFMPTITLRSHQVLRPWSEASATWIETMMGEAWGLPGAQLAGIDYHPEYTDELVGFVGTEIWAEFDVTDLTQYWIDNPGSNFGAAIKAYLHYSTISYSFWSSEGPLSWFRPQLFIEYE
jgi:hypothetical protein